MGSDRFLHAYAYRVPEGRDQTRPATALPKFSAEASWSVVGPFNDEAIDSYLRDVGVVDVGSFTIDDFRLSRAGAERFARTFSYTDLSVHRVDKSVPAENVIPILKPTLARLEINRAVFTTCAAPFDHLVPSLEHLDFSFTNLDNRALESFRVSRVLEWLKCDSTNVNLAAIEVAASIESLRYIGLVGNGFSVHDLLKLPIPTRLQVGV